MIYLFHGDEEFGKNERIAALKARLGDLAEMNTTVLAGRGLSQEALRHHCHVPPFLGEFRLVIVQDLLTRLAKSKGPHGKASQSAKTFLQWLASYMDEIPESTTLVFSESKKIAARNVVLKAIAKLESRGQIILFATPQIRKGELAAWVRQRARAKKIRLAPRVADDLATFIGPNLRLIDSEMEKLALYAGHRPITQADVALLSPYARESSVFDMVDALGNRKTAQAFRLLAQMRAQGSHPLYLLTMIVRQYRILLKVKDQMSRGLNKNDIATAINLHPYPTQKAMAQCRNYTLAQLQSIYDRLLETDIAIKTGQLEANLALDMLVVELARVGR
jgi:DNA polymerase-3 subunit delta